ncbi:hypothetical protein AC578_6235 [Pseudocercospora eumusae]|uniref:Uncharacterized protein n=1 Tax=Pseudocercospora eumusae TaxID=321146 RepID=A0A139H3D7_9PEZI|nr:hypothetical protein AC578_6235 [Pseudocercospora eumusae]
MCFQGWAHHACGHTRAFEQTCAYADQLDVNFWLKIACPGYSSTSRHLDFKCGKHKYYCAKSEDGEYLEKVHLKRDKAEEKCKELHDQIHNLWPGILRKKFEEHQERGGTREQYMAHPNVKKIQDIMTNLNSEKNEARRDVEKCDYIINETKTFYQLYGDQSIMSTPTHTGMPMAAAFSLGADSQAIAGASMPQMPSAANNLYQADSGVMGGGYYAQPQAGGMQYGNTLGPSPRRLGGLYNPAMANMAEGTPQHYAQVPSHPPQPQIPPPKKRGRGKKKAEEESPKKGPEGVRRSTRVRGKQINYAEELTDVSRSPSPEKSDASAFTPSKSDASASPAKSKNTQQPISRTRNLQQGLHSRASPSLLEKIGEWRRQDSSLTTPSPPKRSFRQQYSQMPSGRPGSPLKNENVRDGYLETPGTITMPERQYWPTQVPGEGDTQSQAHAGAQRGVYPSHTSGVPQQNWIVDRNGSNQMLSAALAIGGMLQPRPQQESQQSIQAPMPSHDYQRMHQALHTSSQARLLAPPPQLRTDAPMKRTVSAPSEGSPSKRPRLSFPSTSDSALLEAQVSHVATPPPEQNFAPSAPMLVPTPAIPNSEEMQAELSSDIDWNTYSGHSAF